jgi:hypothetical protein
MAWRPPTIVADGFRALDDGSGMPPSPDGDLARARARSGSSGSSGGGGGAATLFVPATGDALGYRPGLRPADKAAPRRSGFQAVTAVRGMPRHDGDASPLFDAVQSSTTSLGSSAGGALRPSRSAGAIAYGVGATASGAVPTVGGGGGARPASTVVTGATAGGGARAAPTGRALGSSASAIQQQYGHLFAAGRGGNKR